MQNLQADPRASLFVTEPDTSGDLLGSSRVTLIGNVTRVPETELAAARTVYLAGYLDSKYWVDFEDFSFYRMDVLDVYYVGDRQSKTACFRLEHSIRASVDSPRRMVQKIQLTCSRVVSRSRGVLLNHTQSSEDLRF